VLAPLSLLVCWAAPLRLLLQQQLLLLRVLLAQLPQQDVLLVLLVLLQGLALVLLLVLPLQVLAQAALLLQVPAVLAWHLKSCDASLSPARPCLLRLLPCLPLQRSLLLGQMMMLLPILELLLLPLSCLLD
jgi:hypothetical protein